MVTAADPSIGIDGFRRANTTIDHYARQSIFKELHKEYK